eukprot:SAG31_NODE_3346_length_4376_cov_3.801496_4_plen_282_part_00
MVLLDLPLLLQPLLAPGVTGEQHLPMSARYCAKANMWLVIFSFVGNWFYTHYFYSVLGASYTMPAHDLNGVPVAMFFATHFYFSFYHTLANWVLRRIATTYPPSLARATFTCLSVCCMAYTTAFMEAFTIMGYECYTFKNRHVATTVGSAFYGLYFVVSFPMFWRIDEPIAQGLPPTIGPPANRFGRPASSSSSISRRARKNLSGSPSPVAKNDVTQDRAQFSMFKVCIEALAVGMAVLILLDVVRVAKGDDFHMQLLRPCKTNASLTCRMSTDAMVFVEC